MRCASGVFKLNNSHLIRTNSSCCSFLCCSILDFESNFIKICIDLILDLIIYFNSILCIQYIKLKFDSKENSQFQKYRLFWIKSWPKESIWIESLNQKDSHPYYISLYFNFTCCLHYLLYVWEHLKLKINKYFTLIVIMINTDWYENFYQDDLTISLNPIFTISCFN